MTHINKKSINDLDSDEEPDQRVLFKVMTYNIWSDTQYSQERLEAVIKIIKDIRPDAICLLDVTEPCHDKLVKALKMSYVIFQSFISTGDKSGIVQLFRRDTVTIPKGSEPYYFEGGINLIGTEVEIVNKLRINIIATQFDNRQDNENVRVNEFDLLKKIIKTFDNCIVVGDFNSQSPTEPVEKQINDSKLTDCWIKMGCPSLLRQTCPSTKLRSSRIYYINNESLDLGVLTHVGTANIPEINVLPSIHYGLLATFWYDN